MARNFQDNFRDYYHSLIIKYITYYVVTFLRSSLHIRSEILMNVSITLKQNLARYQTDVYPFLIKSNTVIRYAPQKGNENFIATLRQNELN